MFIGYFFINSLNFLNYSVDNNAPLIMDNLFITHDISIDNFGELGIVGLIESKLAGINLETHEYEPFFIDYNKSIKGNLYLDSYNDSVGELIAGNGIITLNNIDFNPEPPNLNDINQKSNNQWDQFADILEKNKVKKSSGDIEIEEADLSSECN